MASIPTANKIVGVGLKERQNGRIGMADLGQKSGVADLGQASLLLLAR